MIFSVSGLDGGPSGDDLSLGSRRDRTCRVSPGGMERLMDVREVVVP